MRAQGNHTDFIRIGLRSRAATHPWWVGFSGQLGLAYDHSSHIEQDVRKIQLKDAKAKLSTVVDDAVKGKPSIITRHGKREVVLLSYEEWERLSAVPSFGRLLMSAPLGKDDVPYRSPTPLRDAGL